MLLNLQPKQQMKPSRMLKKSASTEKAEVQAKVEAQMKNGRSSLSLDLDLSLPRSLRPCWTSCLSSLGRTFPMCHTYGPSNL